MRKFLIPIFSMLVIASLVLAGCGAPAAAPAGGHQRIESLWCLE